MIEFFRIYGFVGWLCEIFSIDSNKHPFYVEGYENGLEIEILGVEDQKAGMEKFIRELELSISKINPYKTNGVCQVRGFKDAYKKRFCDA